MFKKKTAVFPFTWLLFPPIIVLPLTHIRQGNIYIIDQMMQHGADLHITDLQGKTAMHHAVMGGNMWVKEQYSTNYRPCLTCDLWLKHVKHKHSILFVSPSATVHYLWETGMFQFSDTDMYHVTPLHLAASTGNTEMVRYLLREQVISENSM